MRYLLFLLAFTASASAQTVTGTVTSDSAAVPFATVRVAGTALGVVADAGGAYRIALPAAGAATLTVSSVGYETATRAVTLAAGQTLRLDVALAEAAGSSDAVVVTGTMTRIGVRESPVKVDVVPPRFLETSPSVNVMDAIGRVNGLYQQVDCGVCNTNSIRINGIEGPNTAVLIDGMPVMSSLATVYGLNGISPILIRQIEVVKGPMSTLYGSEALGGVINIITKDPATAPTLSTNLFTTSFGEMAGEFAAVPLRGRTSALVSGTVFHNGTFRDRNGDDFADAALNTRVALFGKITRQDEHGFERGSLIAKLYSERRAGGVRAFFADTDGLRGSGSVYGESIYTTRAEIIGALALRSDVMLRASGAVHRQDSFYGATAYDADQIDGFAQLLYTPATDGTRFDGHDVIVGAAARAIRYDDGSAATGDYDAAGALVANRPDARLIPGLFVQDDWTVSPVVRLLGGFRADYQPGYGLIPSPRVALKLQPARATTARLNVGTGFRVVNLFTEDHAAYTGGRATLILEDLRPERSVSTAASVQHVFGDHHPVTVDVDAFWTQFSNKIEPDYSVQGEIRYANLAGSATTRGVSVQVQATLANGVGFTVGGTLLDVFRTTGGVQTPIEFAADYQATATLEWAAPWGLDVDYTATITGPMALPRFDAATAAGYLAATGTALRAESPVYTVHNLQVTTPVRFGGRLAQVYASVDNLFDFRQPSPLVGFYDGVPGYAESFDTVYVYGPVQGRRVGLGVRVTLP